MTMPVGVLTFDVRVAARNNSVKIRRNLVELFLAVTLIETATDKRCAGRNTEYEQSEHMVGSLAESYR